MSKIKVACFFSGTRCIRVFQSPPRKIGWRQTYQQRIATNAYTLPRDSFFAGSRGLLVTARLHVFTLPVVYEWYWVMFTEYQDIDSWWTSGNFMVRNQQWMWTSKHHLKPISYSRWASAAEPAVDSTASPARMHCLLLDRSLQYHWVEANCADRHNFICEQDDA